MNCLSRLVTRCLLLSLLSTVALLGQGGPPGARVANLYAEPTEPGLILAATTTGVFRSDNGGLSWGPSNIGLTNVAISKIAGSQGRLYLGTALDGVFRSDDLGLTWQRVSNGLNILDIRSLAVDRNNPDVVYAGTRNGGIFMTDNGGQGWITVNNGLLTFTPDGGTPVFEGDYNDIAIDPNDSQVLYAVHSSIVTPGSGVLFRSTNGAAQWSGLDAGTAGLALAIDPNDSGTVYVGASLGLSVTHDSFASATAPPELFGRQITEIRIDPVNTDTVYAATRLAFTFRSTDRGATWETIRTGMPFSESSAFAVDPHTPTTVFAGFNGGGVYRSADSGDNWQISSDGMFGTDIRALAIDPQDSSNILAGGFGAGIFRTEDGGDLWEEAREGLLTVQPRSLAFAPQNPQIVYTGGVDPFGQADGSLFRSTNGGRDWVSLATGLSFFSIAVDPLSADTFYIGTTAGVLRSTDGGMNFTPRNDVEDQPNNALQFWTITDLAIDPSNRNVIYAIGNTPDFITGFTFFQFFKSTNAGENWRPTGLTFTPLTAIAVDPTDTRRIYLGSQTGIFRNQDGVENDGFEPISAGLPGDGAVSVTSLAVDGQDNAAVYAATSAGVYKSTDRGGSWALADTGLEVTLARIIRDDPMNAGVLYTGTTNGGVLKTVDAGATWLPTRNALTLLPVISRAGLVGSANFDGAGVAGGEIVSFFALNVGPEVGVSAQFDPKTGKLATELAGVRVFFSDIPAALFFVRRGQVNCQVPFEVIGLENVEVRIEVDGVSSNVITVNILDSHPGIFGSVLNGTGGVNSAENTIAAGSFVSLFTTGQGTIQPPLMTGQAAPLDGTLHLPVQPVSVTLDGQLVASASAMAPTFVGLLQINVIIPADLPPGEYEVFIQIGNQSSATGIVIHVG
jgi:uncharacterized protein (TIGR03437 family)